MIATASQLAEVHTSDLMDACPKRVQLRHEGKIIGETPGALYRGQLFHEAVAGLYQRNKWDRPACEAAILAAARVVAETAKRENRPFTEAVANGASTHQAEVLDLVVQYAARFHPMPQDKIIGCELPIRWTMEHPSLPEPVNFASHIDLLFRRDTLLCVYDYKLRQDDPSRAFLARNPQLGLYWLMVRYGQVCIDVDADLWVAFGEWSAVAWVHAPALAPYGKAYTNTHTGEAFKKGDLRPADKVVRWCGFHPDQEGALRDALAERVGMMRAGFFPAIPDPVGCGLCEAWKHCPRYDAIGGGE